MSISLEKFVEIYNSTEPTVVPINWQDELLEIFQGADPGAFPAEQQGADNAKLSPNDIVGVWKMLIAQEWFIDAFKRRGDNEAIAEDCWMRNYELLKWWVVKHNKAVVVSGNKLSTNAVHILMRLSYHWAVNELEGRSLEEIYEEKWRGVSHKGVPGQFYFHRLEGFEND